MLEKEKLLKNQRTIEATQKNFMGLEGKFGCILKHLGDSVIMQSSSLYSENPMPNVWDIPNDDEELPVTDEDEAIYEIGRHFSGLRAGIHLEITYFKDNKKLEVSYKGYPVYREIENELEMYTPFMEWEDKINKLHEIAKRKEKDKMKEIKEIKKIKERSEKLNFLEKLRNMWGLK